MEQNKNMSTLKLISSRDEAGNVRTFIFETSGLTWIAGQSQGYILPQAGETEAENQRWFTIVSAPSEGVIHITTRVSESRFKQTLNAMKPGEEIKAFDLGGDFTWEEESDEPVVMVAGGIGVTPFRSILLERHRAGKPLNATLLYFKIKCCIDRLRPPPKPELQLDISFYTRQDGPMKMHFLHSLGFILFAPIGDLFFLPR
jgi:ferredoxin-NADP reductase